MKIFIYLGFIFKAFINKQINIFMNYFIYIKNNLLHIEHIFCKLYLLCD